MSDIPVQPERGLSLEQLRNLELKKLRKIPTFKGKKKVLPKESPRPKGGSTEEERREEHIKKIEEDIFHLEEKKRKRSLKEKIKYLFTEDPLNAQITLLKAARQKHMEQLINNWS